MMNILLDHPSVLLALFLCAAVVAVVCLYKYKQVLQEQKTLTRRLHERDQELDAFTVLMVFDTDWRLVHVNSLCERVFGFNRASVLQHVFPLFQPDSTGGLRKQNAYLPMIKHAMEHAGEWSGQLHLMDARAVPFWLHAKMVVSTFSDDTHYILTGVDVTELVSARERSKEQSAFGQEVLQTMPVALIIVEHKQNRVVFWNHASEALFQLAETEVMMHALTELSIDWNQDVLHAIAHLGTASESSDWLEQHVAMPDDTIRYCNVRIMPIVVSSIRASLIMVTDVSNMHELEQRLRITGRLEAMGELAAGIAHEINSPLQFVKNNLHFLRDEFKRIQDMNIQWDSKDDAREWEVVCEDFPEAIDHSIDGVERITGIVSSMRMLSHPGDGTVRSFDLNAMIDDSVTITKNAWKYVATVEKTLEETSQPFFCYAELSQVFINLIVNAAHAIEEAQKQQHAGGMVSLGRITITTHWQDDGVEIRVADTGCGIAPEKLTRIFDAFYTTKEPGKGTGQGLAISHDVVVRRHHGILDVESTPGKGTTFILMIPYLQKESQNMALQ